jgi:uncharacterized protein
MRTIEIRHYKWPRRYTGLAFATLLGEDQYGQWLGVRKGDQWWSADPSRSGVFINSLVKLVPHNTFWSVCFQPADPVVDVDIILPVTWQGDILEEVDLELDILRAADGRVWVRDQDKFAQVRAEWPMPEDIASQAQQTCEQVRSWVEQGAEPFGSVGFGWLERFMKTPAVSP